MKLTRQDVQHVAQLAMLSFTDEEEDALIGDLSKILGYAEKISEVDTENVEPLTHVIEVNNVTGEDDPAGTLSIDEALQNAPSSEGRFFKIPRIL